MFQFNNVYFSKIALWFCMNILADTFSIISWLHWKLIFYPGLFIYNKHGATGGGVEAPYFLITIEKFSKDNAFSGFSAPSFFIRCAPCPYKDTWPHFFLFPLRGGARKNSLGGCQVWSCRVRRVSSNDMISFELT